MPPLDRSDATPQPTLEQQIRRQERRTAGWPALAGLVLGAVLVLRLRSLGDRSLTQDTQLALLTGAVVFFVATPVLALVSRGLRRLLSRSPNPTAWWFASSWVTWWLAIITLVAYSVIGFWQVATTGEFLA